MQAAFLAAGLQGLQLTHTCLEGVPGQGDVCEGDNLAVALPNLKVLEHQQLEWA